MLNNFDPTVTVPVEADDFIHIQVHYLIHLLRRKANPPDSYHLESKTKEEVIKQIYASDAQIFKSPEQQLGKFFTNIINSLVEFRNEVLIDFPINYIKQEEGKRDDRSKI